VGGEIPTWFERSVKQHIRVEAGTAGIDPPAAVNGYATSLHVLPLILGLTAVVECGVAAAEVGIALAARDVRARQYESSGAHRVRNRLGPPTVPRKAQVVSLARSSSYFFSGVRVEVSPSLVLSTCVSGVGVVLSGVRSDVSAPAG
jgi:hypothetical protein